ncbi:hypothetical protein [Rheinheimera sp.]|uniref:hypothetical protein n=1 Tax=Rheinheimera sp. TaxID=1869214 RepID=UPI003D279454
MSKTHTLLLSALLSSVLWFWLWPQEQTSPHRQQAAAPNPVATQSVSAESPAHPAQATTAKATPVCQQVLPDQDWFKTPEREAIRQYLYERLQQGDSPEQLLLMLRDRPTQDKALSQRQAELQLDLQEMLIRYEESQLPRVPIGPYLDFFNLLRQKEPAEKIVLLRSAPEVNLLFEEERKGGRLTTVQPKTFLLTQAQRIGQFEQAIIGLHFHPRDYHDFLAGENILTMPQFKLLLQQTDDLNARIGLRNLADQAVYFLRPDLLTLLASYQILPSSKDGLYSAMDIAFSSPWRQQGWSYQQRRAQQQATIQYLQQLGYPLHAELKTTKNNRHYLQVHALQEPGFISYDEDLINLAKAQQLLPLQSLPAPELLRALLKQYQQLDQQQQQIKTACQAEHDAEQTAQGLWSESEVINQLDQLTQQHSAGELPQLLHQKDPALLAFYWQQQDTGLATSYGDVPSTEAEFVKAIENSPGPKQAADLLLVLSMQPQWAKHWPNGLAVSQLENMLTYEGTKHWQVMQQNGFDLGIIDTSGRNLYPQAFADSAEAVSLLINAKVPLQQNPLGPDALDLALDASYLQQKLHPALFYILQETERLRPSHLSRLKRLQQYRPALFQQLQTQFKLPDLTAMTPNPMLSLEP